MDTSPPNPADSPKRPTNARLSSKAARRLHGFETTIFAEMSALALSTGSVNLGQGFPDASGPESVSESAIAAIRDGHNQYPPGHGNPVLVEAITRHQQRHYDLDITGANVVVTTGATEAIAASVLALVDPGDEVIVIEPYYDSYPAMISFAGGHCRTVRLRAPDFALDPAELAAAVSPNTKAILINTPHNPTGHVFNSLELAAIAALAQAHDLVVISDEVYEHLTFDGSRHIPIATLPGMFERTVTISSSGKTFSFTGWKVGWATGPEDVIAAVEGAKNWLSYSSGAPFQPAIAHALDHEESFHRELRVELERKRDHLCAGLNQVGIEVYRPKGTYFVYSDVRPLGFTDGFSFCRHIAAAAKVVAIPGQVFYRNSGQGVDERKTATQIRWAFCKHQAVLDEGLSRLAGCQFPGA